MVTDINEVIANLTKIDSASAMIMESTKKEKLAYAEEIKQKTKEFDESLNADIDKKVSQLKEELTKTNQQLIDGCKNEAHLALARLDSVYATKHNEWIESIFNNVIKE